ncbi:TPA: hypothetical protein ACJL6C_001635 [Neisseria meningitidis]
MQGGISVRAEIHSAKYSGLTKIRTRRRSRIVRQGEATPYWFC